MPVTPEIAESNRSETERLRRIVASLDDAGLRTPLPNGWTIADHLGHLAFWDRHRLCLIQQWAAGDFRSGGSSSEVFNDAVHPLLALIPPERAAAAAVQAAEEIDTLLLELPDEAIAAMLARPDAPPLDRGEHRRHHLDRIEAALA